MPIRAQGSKTINFKNQHNNIKENCIQHNNIQHHGLNCDTQHEH